MTKTIKTVLAVIGALTAICGVLLLLKKLGLIKVCCKKCGKEKCECDKPETVEDFVEEAAEAVEDKVKEVKEAVEEKVEEAKEKAEAIAEEFKDYADVELPKE
ncbi:MAG: hypothetical protein IKQ54_05155 [Oscillospiraceae bacterium]|nr:hypothetical protein [Oscillospiraceae bacterium]MBR4193697.1 hypothetical protein [Oscillospiraceae bacterium]